VTTTQILQQLCGEQQMVGVSMYKVGTAIQALERDFVLVLPVLPVLQRALPLPAPHVAYAQRCLMAHGLTWEGGGSTSSNVRAVEVGCGDSFECDAIWRFETALNRHRHDGSTNLFHVNGKPDHVVIHPRATVRALLVSMPILSSVTIDSPRLFIITHGFFFGIIARLKTFRAKPKL
jgi:hypothetical protein